MRRRSCPYRRPDKLGHAAHAPRIGTDGAVQRWIFPHCAEDVWFLFRIADAVDNRMSEESDAYRF